VDLTGISHDIEDASPVVVLVETVHLLSAPGEKLAADGMDDGICPAP